jgi:signal transduction histidine kinase
MFDPAKIEQVIINLLRNSIQAMAETNVLEQLIEITLDSGPADQFQHLPDIPEWIERNAVKGVSVLEIRDSGPGVDPDQISQIFEPFFTTKTKDQGTGLGLSVVMNIIDLHDGLIRVENMTNPTGLKTSIYFKAVS